MKVGKKGKIFALVGMIALLVVTGYLNVYLNSNSIQSASVSTTVVSNFFETYRLDRISMREQTVMYLDSVINNELSSAETIAQAQQSKIEITNAMESELKLETVIKALGFDDVVVSSSNNNYNVILKTATLEDEEVAKVLEVVTQHTGAEASNVIIIPVE
jgi:stage III sporulation protein AH